MQIRVKPILLTAIVAVVTFNLTGCGGGGGGSAVTSPVTPPAGGTLTVNNNAAIQQYDINTAVVVPVTFNGGAVAAVTPISVTSSNTSVVTVSPNTCYLPGSGSGAACQVVVRGVSAGTASVTVSAAGATPVSIPVTFGGTVPTQPNYGSVQIGAFPSAANPSTSGFNMTAQVGQTVTLMTSLTGFNKSLDGVPIALSTTAGTFVGNPQCNVDSTLDANHYCIYQLKLPATAPTNNTVTVTANVVGNAAGYQTWNSPTVTITTAATPVAGTIALQSTGANMPEGMSSPLWAVLQDSSGVGDTVVTLSASNTNIAINPGVAVNTGPYQTRSCTLSSSNPVCGFGVKGVTAGTASVSATAGGYTISPLALSVNAPDTSSRAITFKNTHPNPVWVGITGGTANSYETSRLVSTIDPATSGPNKMCGPSNPAGACPTGSTCTQGGASPASNTTYFCYWDQPAPSSGYQIQSGSTTIPAATRIDISDSSYDPIADIIWSGNFYPRQGCTVSPGTNQLVCTIADCGNATSGSACAPGTGGAPAVATLPEVTLQKNSTDYYDVSIIGGANVITSFGPDSAASTAASPVPAANGYRCGTAGSSSVQGTLPAADWAMATHVGDTLVVGGAQAYSFSAQTATQPSTAYYRFVSTEAPRQNVGCAPAGGACTTSGFVCGYDKNAIDNGSSSDYTTSCGRHLAWLSANAIWALNANATNAAPFHFNGTYVASSGPTIQDNQLFTCTAPTVSGYSSPIADASLVCGCTDWSSTTPATLSGDQVFTSQIAAPSKSCTANNTTSGGHEWTAKVLPSIAWLKKSCPTCYTYPFDDMSSTFQCSNQASSSTGTNSVPYVITFSGDIAGQ